MQLAERIAQLSNYLETGLYERQHTIRLCLLAALSGESVFLLGPPGIAKSMIARRIKQAFKTVNSFEYLMTRFSTPEEIFGPLSIQALKEEGRYQRLTTGYLPNAEIIFLDEIWKAGPAILNTLLTAINEKKFRNGFQEENIPMRLLVTASNELPESDSSLEALYDRMLIRLCLNKVYKKQNFRALLNSQKEESENIVPKQLQISNEEYEEWQVEISQIKLPDNCFEIIYQLRQQIDNLVPSPYISDRRWKKAIHLLQASAFFNGRDAISPLDIILFKDCLWHDLQSLQLLTQLITTLLIEEGWQQQAITKKIDDLHNEWQQSTQINNNKTAFKLKKENRLFNRIPHYSVSKQINEKNITLFLHTPLVLHNIKVISITLDKNSINDTLNKGKISTRLNGIGYPQLISAQVNSKNQLQVLDASRKSSTLYLNEKIDENKLDKKWLEKLEQLNYLIQQQKSLFSHHQPCFFIENHWLATIEQSFLTLTEKLSQLRTQMMSK